MYIYLKYKGMDTGLKHPAPLCLILIFLQLVDWSNPGPVLGSSGPLYNNHDHFVYSLNTSTLNQNIYSSDRAWLVEFYSSWCGHCISFAPKWIQFADDLKEWRSVVVIAGIDCADEANIPSCRKMEILEYPTLKLFPPHSPEHAIDADGNEKLNIGHVFKSSASMSTMKNNLIAALEPMFKKLLGPSNASISANFTSTAELWKSTEFLDGPPFLLFIYEDSTSFTGREVTLRLSRYNKTVRVLRFHQRNPAYGHLALEGWPGVGYLSRNGSSGSLPLGATQDSAELITNTTIGLAAIKKIVEKPEMETAPRVEIEKQQSTGAAGGDHVSMEDLLQTIRNSLRNEVGLFKKIDGAKLSALQNYLSVLTEYFPFDRGEVKIFLVKLQEWIRSEREIEIAKYLDKLEKLEQEYKPWDLNLNVWYDCRPTVPGRRGYSCGLWRLFHVLTVIAYEKREDSAVLTAIHGYVTEIFGCQECSTHFGEMVVRDKALDIHSIHEQMIWLWKRHNEVNIRLKNATSEDPGFPKDYYPSVSNCASCRVANTNNTQEEPEFNEKEVAEYLVRVYSRAKRYVNKNRDGVNKALNSGASKVMGNTTWLGGYFGLTDVGILMMLYFKRKLTPAWF